MSTQEPYNPLAKTNLGERVADALLRSPVHSLNETAHLVRAGVYAIYYIGAFPAYKRIRELNEGGRFGQPIYVGKAVPKGARKGGLSFDAGKGTALRDRLRQHATTIKETNTVAIGEFYFRALTVDDIWIPLGENVLIEKFQPLWNRVIDGFGSKTPGKGRAKQVRSQWDTLHPGRTYVELLGLGPHPLTPEQIAARIEAFFKGQLPEAEKLAPGEEDRVNEA
ncbi:MAG: Eco29kI family restriction endonuclease [Betaproteobacteria bacterium]|nr:Eco29kI family restriction endonuclease [Betaproteobacteria bacterium]